MLTDANGNFTVLMWSNDQREPFTDPSQLPTSGIIVRLVTRLQSWVISNLLDPRERMRPISLRSLCYGTTRHQFGWL